MIGKWGFWEYNGIKYTCQIIGTTETEYFIAWCGGGRFIDINTFKLK